MKNLIIILVGFLILPILSFAQSNQVFDFVSSLNDGYAAIKKGDQWSFINSDGKKVMDFRNDLVLTKCDDGLYPVFMDGRCLIEKKIDGISYFGYIDPTGKVVIEPQFLNASNFNNQLAVAIYLLKEKLGQNDVLGKNVVNYRYFEVVIDTDGNIKSYLDDKGVNVVLDKKYLRLPPKITSKLISENLSAVMVDKDHWTIKKIQ
ncbi:WG repeat-containing protein [Aegicerativicinus sediminis]|uniref:WG repeat-containing protein n=1 Tax=Aegicerativicinus sediminis TaxID=2893202 RepID=UPI001E4D0BAA|nr:WG repeat-containing protein [Aegicerativicinus sediminis]